MTEGKMNKNYKRPDNAEEQITLCENCANELDAEPCDSCGIWSVNKCENCGAESVLGDMFLADGTLDMSKQIPHSWEIVQR
jgi:hypothetical protein